MLTSYKLHYTGAHTDTDLQQKSNQNVQWVLTIWDNVSDRDLYANKQRHHSAATNQSKKVELTHFHLDTA